MVGVMSMAVPTTITSTIMVAINSLGLSNSGSSKPTTMAGNWATVMSHDDTMAAATKNITTAVVWAADKNKPYKWLTFSSPYTRVEISKAYTAATTAASVGVNTPNFRPTTTITGNTRAKVASLKAAATSERVLRGGTGTFSRRANHHQVIHSEAPNIKPGTIPAMNSLEMDTLAATPKITNAMLGGMTGAMMLAEASKPAERALSCPAAVIMGSSKAARAAASATADPDKAAIKQAETIAT